MHESSLLVGLIAKIEAIAREENAARVTNVTVRLGALSNISPGHFREHFEQAVPGTIAEGAALEVIAMEDLSDALAQEILLDSVEVE
jgi:hydrogenase nickel incorporation protein HypA/HybF